jgi:predicted RNA-binding Zn-ribbon protein involved in translation (DUF1610 family)
VNTRFVNIVQSAMRAVAVCPVCGRRIAREDSVRLGGERYHRNCAHYTPQGRGRG